MDPSQTNYVGEFYKTDVKEESLKVEFEDR